MTRNMDKRVEIAWPVLDEKLRDRILSYIDVSLSDTAKLRELLPNRRYTPLGFFAQVSPEGKTIRFDSQAHFMDEARLKARMSTEVEVEREVEKREMEKREVVVGYQVGDSVKITEGALESFLGVVEEIDIDKNKVRVVVSMFGRETPVELDLDQVEPVEL